LVLPPAIVLVASVPAIAITLMLHRGAPLAPHLTALLGGLAAAALGAFGVRFFCTQDGSLMVLIWQFGTVCVLSALAGCAGHHLLKGTDTAGEATRTAVRRRSPRAEGSARDRGRRRSVGADRGHDPIGVQAGRHDPTRVVQAAPA
jgi:hypothetical protein